MPPLLARGDVVLTRFPFTDLTGSSVRPALVVSQGLKGQDVILAGISSVVRTIVVPTDYLVESNHSEFPRTGLRVTSVIRTHKLVAVESAILIRRMGHIGPLLQTEVDRLLRLVLGL